MAIILPTNKPCLVAGWRAPQLDHGTTDPIPQVCPAPLLIAVSTSGYFHNTHFNFNGRGWADTSVTCPYTEPYYSAAGLIFSGLDYREEATYTYTTRFTIDVWKAYLDGVWTSSCTIQLHANNATLLPASIYFHAHPRMYETTAVRKSVTTSNTGCSPSVLATVTVNDDGTFSIA